MRQPNHTDPIQLFSCHICTVCAIAVLALTLDAADPTNPTVPITLASVAAMIRWSGIESAHGDNAGLMSTIVLDTGLGLLAADTTTFWT